MKHSKGWTRLFIVWCVIWLALTVPFLIWIDEVFSILMPKTFEGFLILTSITWLVGILFVYLTWRVFWWVVAGFNSKGPEKDE